MRVVQKIESDYKSQARSLPLGRRGQGKRESESTKDVNVRSL